MNNPLVSIILVNYRQIPLTLQCIASIKENVHSVSYEIIVVDNSPTDTNEKSLKDILWGSLQNNVGFGTANNIGVSKAKGEYIFLLNNDTILKNDFLDILVSYLKNHQACGVIGGYLHHLDGSFSLSGGHIYSISKTLHSIICHTKWRPDLEVQDGLPYQRVEYVIGADMFMRRKVFTEIGGFDENIFMYYEDVELCNRLLKAGYYHILIDSPTIIHLDGASSSKDGILFRKTYNTASLIYVLKKKYGSLLGLVFQILYFCLKLPHMFLHWQERDYVLSILFYKKYLRKTT